MLFPAGVGSGTFRFFNSAGVGAPRFSTGRFGSSSGSGSDGAGGADVAATSVAVGAGRFRTGRSGSSSASGAEDGAADAPESVARVGRFSTGRFGSSSAGAAAGGVDAAGAVVAGVEDAGTEAVDPPDGASSPGLAFGLARLNTGGPSGNSGAGFDMTALFLAAASFAAAIAVSDRQVPAPTQVLLPCRAPVTVNSPWDTPVRNPSYTVPVSSAIGTGAALYAAAS